VTQRAVLALEDGTVFEGQSIGASGTAVGEAVFNTAMTGYQEILTDPSYASQLVTLTYPHIGNTGCNEFDEESTQPHAAGLIIRDLPRRDSNWRKQQGLSDYLIERGVPGIADIDTRQLTRLLRSKGAQNACLTAGTEVDTSMALQLAKDFAGLKGMDLAKEVTCVDAYDWQEGSFSFPEESANSVEKRSFRVVAYDFGVKRNILRLLVDHGCQVKVVPAKTSAEEVLAMNPDGIFLSNGPGDPEPCDYAITAIAKILEAGKPTFGICLGHQLLALASGAGTEKMKFGHHGANHPVQDLASGQVLITSQNHGFAVTESGLPEKLRPTHRSLFDQSLQGIERIDVPAFGFQGHPEASPGPHDIAPLFQRFVALMGANNA